MTKLSELKNTSRKKKRTKLLGRGPGSGLGKTSGRGFKGQGARSGAKRRWTYEGGQFRLFMKLPHRGFSNAQFTTTYHPINLYQVDKAFNDGEVVNFETLKSKGLVSGRKGIVKLLGEGELSKKVSFEVHAASKSAREKVEKANLSLTLLDK